MSRLLSVCVVLLLLGCKGSADVFLDVEGKVPMAAALCGGKLFVADTAKNEVLLYDKSNKLIKTVSGFKRPMDIVCNDETVFVADFHLDQIIVMNLKGEKLSSFGQTGSKPGQFKAPAGLGLADNHLYVAEFYGGRVQKLNLQGKPLGFVGSPKGEKTFTYPTDVYGDTSGSVIVADTYAHEIKFFSDNKLVRTLSKKQYGLNVPTGILPVGDSLYVADSGNFRVLRIDSDGRASTIWKHGHKLKRYSPSRVALYEEKLLVVDNTKGRLLSQAIETDETD